MIPKDAESFAWHASVCRKKIHYESRSVAKKWAKHFKNKLGDRTRPYLCQLCGQYHLCSSKNKS